MEARIEFEAKIENKKLSLEMRGYVEDVAVYYGSEDVELGDIPEDPLKVLVYIEQKLHEAYDKIGKQMDECMNAIKKHIGEGKSRGVKAIVYWRVEKNE